MGWDGLQSMGLILVEQMVNDEVRIEIQGRLI